MSLSLFYHTRCFIGADQPRLTWMRNFTEGMVWTSAVTLLVIPRLARLPRIKPHVKATYLGACSRNWVVFEMRVRNRKLLSCNT